MKDFESLIMSIIIFGMVAAIVDFFLVSYVLGDGKLPALGQGFEAGVGTIILVVIVVWFLSGRFKNTIDFSP